MTDAEISRRLALAIGWKESQIYPDGDGSFCSLNISNVPFIQVWKDFDYDDPAVIWPIAERFNLFPRRTHTVGVWACRLLDNTLVNADTAAKAVALAVIAAKGG